LLRDFSPPACDGGLDHLFEMFLEELVGEIYDEFDKDFSKAERHPNGTIDLAGSFPIHDLDELGVVCRQGPTPRSPGWCCTDSRTCLNQALK
jgi:hypothetical protein